MKNYIFITVAALTMMTSCKDPQKDELVIRERDSLLTVIDERNVVVDDFIASFNEVEENLDKVRDKQRIILLNSDKLGDLKPNQKERIGEEIKAINELMDINTKKLKQLNTRLDRSDKKNIQLVKTIELLNAQLNQRYSELTELNNKLSAANVQIEQLITVVDILATDNTEQNQIITEKNAELHTAYYS